MHSATVLSGERFERAIFYISRARDRSSGRIVGSVGWAVASAGWVVISAGWVVISAGRVVVSAGWGVVSAGWVVVSAGWVVVSAGRVAVSAGWVVVKEIAPSSGVLQTRPGKAAALLALRYGSTILFRIA